VLLFTDELYWRPAGQLDDTYARVRTVFPDIFGAQFFQHLAGDDDRARLFEHAIATVSATEHGAIAGSYDFASVARWSTWPVGPAASLARCSARIPGCAHFRDREPGPEWTPVDVPPSWPAGGRRGSDFFVSLPTGGDYYVLIAESHDKNETSAGGSCGPAARDVDGARLLVVDRSCH